MDQNIVTMFIKAQITVFRGFSLVLLNGWTFGHKHGQINLRMEQKGKKKKKEKKKEKEKRRKKKKKNWRK